MLVQLRSLRQQPVPFPVPSPAPLADVQEGSRGSAEAFAEAENGRRTDTNFLLFIQFLLLISGIR